MEHSYDDERPLLASPSSRGRRWKTWLYHIAMALLALGWLIPLLRSDSQVEIYGKPDQSPLPPEVFGRVKKTFYPDERYVGPSNETHHHWDHLVAGHDALYVADPKAYGLSKGIHPPFDHPGKVNGGPENFYVISLLHQLHCLVRQLLELTDVSLIDLEHCSLPLLSSQDWMAIVRKL